MCRPSTRPAATGASGAATSSRSSPAPGPGRQQAGPSVLLVDDDERMRELVRVELEREGYDVHEAASADEGLAAIETRKPELVLLDVMMPHVDGWEMLRRIQERHGAGAIPVLMFSGQVDEDARRQAASSGAHGIRGQGLRPRRARRAGEGDRPGLAAELGLAVFGGAEQAGAEEAE